LVRERATRRGIALHMTVDERIGHVQGDERKIRQVLLNLLSNAIKFTPEGGRIEVAAKPVDGSVEISVRDTGVGIAPEDQEAIFEEFKQVGMASKKVEGTGLGLALSRKFIELHGGRIWVKSEIGVGWTFTFAIPVGQGEGGDSGRRGRVMDRRRFLLTSLAGTVGVPLATAAEGAAKHYRLGYLAQDSASSHAPYLEAFRDGLRERGWIEGRNITIEARYA